MESLELYALVIVLTSKILNRLQSENEFDRQIYLQIVSAAQREAALVLNTDLIRFRFSQHIHILKTFPQTSHTF